MDLAGQVMARQEYGHAPGISRGPITLDHRHQATVTRWPGPPERRHDPHPGTCLVAQPIEIFFSVIQKKVVTPNDFGSLEQLSRTLLAFIDRYNQTTRPFSWKFTASDLHDLMDRISKHNQPDPQDEPLPQAA